MKPSSPVVFSLQLRLAGVLAQEGRYLHEPEEGLGYASIVERRLGDKVLLRLFAME